MSRFLAQGLGSLIHAALDSLGKARTSCVLLFPLSLPFSSLERDKQGPSVLPPIGNEAKYLSKCANARYHVAATLPCSLAHYLDLYHRAFQIINQVDSDPSIIQPAY